MKTAWVVVFLSALAAGAAAASDEALALPSDCEYAVTKKECFATAGCYWCAGRSFAGQQSVCVDPMQAKHLPSWVYHCTHQKDPKTEEPVVVVAPAPDCRDPTDKDECLKNSACSWCEGKYTPGQGYCTDQDGAKYVPKDWWKCSSGEQPAEAVTEVAAVQKGGVDPTPGMDCTNVMERKECLKNSKCYWCDNRFTPGVGARCMDETQAKFLPDMAFKCKRGKKPKPAPAPGPDPSSSSSSVGAASGGDDPTPTPAGDSCMDAKDKKACRDIAGCAWCENQFSPDGSGSQCLDADQAQYIPPSVFKCKASKKKADPSLAAADASGGDDPEPTPAPAPADPCKDAKDKKSCRHIAECAWCKNLFTPDHSGDMCVNADYAKYIPASVFKCKASKKKSDPAQPGLLSGVSAWFHSFTKGASGGDSPYAPGGGDSPYGPGGGGGQAGCQSAMDKKACLKIETCYWCDNKFTPGMGARCTDETQAKFLPDMVFKCKAAKKKRGDDKHHRKEAVF